MTHTNDEIVPVIRSALEVIHAASRAKYEPEVFLLITKHIYKVNVYILKKFRLGKLNKIMMKRKKGIPYCEEFGYHSNKTISIGWPKHLSKLMITITLAKWTRYFIAKSW